MATLQHHQPAGVAIELREGLVVTKLLQAGLTVYPINPKLSHAWVKHSSVNECKSDPGDARSLAAGLERYHDQLQPLEPDDALTREIAALAAIECRFIKSQTQFVQRLKACLKGYFPEVLGWFRDWTSPAALSFIRRFPTPEKLQNAPKASLCRFLKTQRINLTPAWQERIQQRGQEVWPEDEVAVAAGQMQAECLVKVLRQLQQALKQQRQTLVELFEEHPDAGIFSSLPGAGEKLAPRMLAHFGSRRDRFPEPQALQQLSGTAPVTKGSGKTKTVHMRLRCQKSFRNTMHLFAQCSINACDWARALYDKARAAGDTHAQALRKLANRWLKIIHRMWINHEPYDNGKYLESLIKRGSPLLEYMRS